LPTAYTDLYAALYLLHKAVGNSAMNTNLETVTNGEVNFVYPGQSVGNGSINAPRYLLRRNERSSQLEAAQIMPLGLLRPVQLHYSAMNFISAFSIHSRISNSAESLKSWMGDGRIFFSAPLSLIKAFRMNIISTGSILLDSTFKIKKCKDFFISTFSRSKDSTKPLKSVSCSLNGESTFDSFPCRLSIFSYVFIFSFCSLYVRVLYGLSENLLLAPNL
jgi:hypothetical protein